MSTRLASEPLALAVLLAALGLTAGRAGVAQQVTATDAPTQGLEEIIVTAEKRSERLQDVPASVTALSAEDLQQRGISGVASLTSGDVPSVRVEPFAGNATILEVAIRGFVNPDGNDITNEQLVPVYIDDVYYGRQIATAIELNDLDNLTVLRGPQGTLFGKNSMGGALVLTSKEPTGQFGVDTTAEGGNLGYFRDIVHVNLPSIAGVNGKIDFLTTGDSGWTTNPAAGQHNYGITKSTGGKLTLLWKPSDALSVEYAGDYTKLKTTEAWNALLSTTDPYTASAWPVQDTTPRSEPYDTYRPFDQQTYWGHRLSANLQLNDAIRLKSVTAFRVDQATTYNTAQNSSTVPGPFFSPGFTNPTSPTFDTCLLGAYLCGGAFTGVIPVYQAVHREISEELQLIGKLDTLDWVVGAFYLKETGAQNETTYFDTFLPNSLGGSFFTTGFLPITPKGSTLVSNLPGFSGAGFGPVSNLGATIYSRTLAGFGQATWRPPGFDDKIALSGGVRVSSEDKSAIREAPGEVWAAIPYTVDGVTPAGAPCPQSPGCTPSTKVTETTPMVSATYKWTPDVSTYLRYAKGYQAPGLSVGSQLFQYVKTSTVDNYEAGLHSEWIDHTLRFNLSAFYMVWKNPQEGVQTTSASTVEFYSGKTIKITGAELETAYAPTRDLTFTGALTVLHGTQPPATDPYEPPADSSNGAITPLQQIVALPKWAASIGVDDVIARTDYGVVRFSAQGNGTASYYTVPGNTQQVPTYWLIDARIGLNDIPLGQNGGLLGVNFWGKNLTDKSYQTFNYQAPGTAPGTASNFSPFGVPRTYGIAVQYKYK